MTFCCTHRPTPWLAIIRVSSAVDGYRHIIYRMRDLGTLSSKWAVYQTPPPRVQGATRWKMRQLYFTLLLSFRSLFIFLMRQKRSKSRLGRKGGTGKKRGRGNCNQGILCEKEKKPNKFSIKEKKPGLWFPRKDWTIGADQTIYNWWVIYNFRARTNLFYILYEATNMKTAGVCMATRQM